MNSYCPYVPEELLACTIARLVAEAGHVAIGAASPIPATGVFLSKFLYNKKMRISLLHKRDGNPFTEGSRELFDLAGQGRIDVFFLGGAQIDGAANINLVHAEGKRFPGSFGSAFMYPVIPRTILFREEHSRRVLVPKVDFVSARGNPVALLTGKALFAWQKDRRRFRLESIHPEGSLEEILDSTGFEFDCGPDLTITPVPSAADLALLRSAVATEIAANYPEFAARVWPETPAVRT
jgi:glutaconate CoA-transferase subunit B